MSFRHGEFPWGGIHAEACSSAFVFQMFAFWSSFVHDWHSLKEKILKKSINYVKGGSSYCKLCGNRRKCNYSHLRAVGIDTSEKKNNMAKCPPVFCLCRGGSRNFGRGEGQNFWKLVSSRSMLNQVQMTQSKHCCVITSLSYVFAGAMSKLNFVVS